MGTVTGTRGSANQAELASIVGWTWRDRIGHVWHRLCAAVDEMNYAVRRMAELQTRYPQ